MPALSLLAVYDDRIRDVSPFARVQLSLNMGITQLLLDGNEISVIDSLDWYGPRQPKDLMRNPVLCSSSKHSIKPMFQTGWVAKA